MIPAAEDIKAKPIGVDTDTPGAHRTEPLSTLQTDRSEGENSLLKVIQTAGTATLQGDSQRVLESETANRDIDSETATPSLFRASSVETIKARPSNPAILVHDFPLTTTPDSSIAATTLRPAKFKSNNILVPDYRWTKEQGMIASPTSPSLVLSMMLKPKTKTLLQPSGVSTSLFAPISTSSWADQISPRTVISPVQYADAPPLQAWQKPKAAMGSNLCADNSATQTGVNSPDAAEESPFLPITAYSFSTDSSSPPATPAEQRQEVITPENEQVDLPALGVYSDPATHAFHSHTDGDAWQNQAQSDHYSSDSSPIYRNTMAPAPLQAWMVDVYLHQMSQLPANEMWSSPLTSGYGVPKTRFQLAKHLAKQARAGDLPPQVPQSITNYRSTCISAECGSVIRIEKSDAEQSIHFS